MLKVKSRKSIYPIPSDGQVVQSKVWVKFYYATANFYIRCKIFGWVFGRKMVT